MKLARSEKLRAKCDRLDVRVYSGVLSNIKTLKINLLYYSRHKKTLVRCLTAYGRSWYSLSNSPHFLEESLFSNRCCLEALLG